MECDVCCSFAEMNNSRRIALVYPFANLDSVPCLVSTVLLLAEHGYWVDVFTCFENLYVRPKLEHPKITIFPLDPPARHWHPLGRLLPPGICRKLTLLLRNRKAKYTCVIGVDPEGLAIADMMARFLNVPYVYYSLELLLSYEIHYDHDKKKKEQELKQSRKAAFSIIQDEKRAELLSVDNSIPPEKIICIPNSPLGRAKMDRSDYLRRKFDLPDDVRIILHPGTLEPWAGVMHLIRSTGEWPDDWVLVCHSRSRISREWQAYISALEFFTKPGKVFFSTTPVSRDEYQMLIRSADIGAAFYCPADESDFNVYQHDNIRFVGLSSGKMAYCLQAGIPVIVNNISSLKNLVGEYGCGEVCDDISSTTGAIRKIVDNYDAYTKNALDCFQHEFDIAGKFGRVLSELEKLSGSVY